MTNAAANTPAALRRWSLWISLLLLLCALLVMLAWLARRFDADLVQQQVERDAQAAASDIRAALARNVQTLQSLQVSAALHSPDADAPPSAGAWAVDAASLLREHREWLRLEWRDTELQILAQAGSPFRRGAFDLLGRVNAQQDVALACAAASRRNAPVYAPSYYLPQAGGLGLEVMELCLPVAQGGKALGYYVATYSLAQILADFVAQPLARTQEISFTEADGTRLAVVGTQEQRANAYAAQQLLDLPGNTLVLRVQSWRAEPSLLASLFPSVLTTLVSGMALTLLGVLALLARDMRRRLQAEGALAEALAFRQAMEDSLVTGLRARDLQGRITYVNPAFCQMVGFSAAELVGHGTSLPNPPPYWPPEFMGEYQQRQAVRLAGHAPPREGHESVFMRKDGSRFPVLIIEAPLINAVGKQTGWMSAFLDISAQRRMEDTARATQERLQATARLATVGEMASLLSHELNQPLAAIASYAQGAMNLLAAPGPAVASAGAPHQQEQQESLQTALQRIASQAERAGRVIASVQDLVARRQRPREAVPPAALIESIMPLVRLQARKLRVRIDVQMPADLPPVVCDRSLVEQVLLNLARNAMQAMDQSASSGPGSADYPLSSQERVLGLEVVFVPASANLPLATHRAGAAGGKGSEGSEGASPGLRGWLAFAVQDSGPGISSEVASQLYTPFFTTKAEGMGLGLALCRTVVEQHGGVLEFESEPGRGTRFRFTLPVHAAPADRIHRPEPNAATP